MADSAAAGFSAKAVEVLAEAADAERFRDLGQRPGVKGLGQRLRLNLAQDLDLARRSEQKPPEGDALEQAVVTNDHAKRLAPDIPRRHGGHLITCFDRWTIEALDQIRS